jgi:hypothetical protein
MIVGLDCEVHRVAHVAVEPTDDEPLGGRDGRRRSDALHDEAAEGVQEGGRAGDDEEGTRHPKGQPEGVDLPAGEPPRDEATDDARGKHQEGRASGGGLEDPPPRRRPRCGHRFT